MGDERDDPVVIGGLGGSGTRAVAALLRASGLDLREPVNQALDSQWAELLLKRPRWLPLLLRTERPVLDIVDALGVLRAMCNGVLLSRVQIELLAAAAVDHATASDEGIEGVGWWKPHAPFRHIANFFLEPPAAPDRPWGWKAPVSHVLLPEIIAAFPNARYVHVVRNPLDMAWSTNLQGVRLWGRLCGIERAEVDASPQNAQLAWWLYSMESAVARGRTMGDRFLLVRFEQLCEEPLDLTRQLSAFAGLQPDEVTLREASGHVQPPASIGRSQEHELDMLDPLLLRSAEAWQSWMRGWELGDTRRGAVGSASE